MRDLQYRSGFRQWDENAWVRCKPHRTPPFSPGLHFFPPELCPLLSHSVVQRAPAALREKILLHSLYLHLHFTVQLELGPVNEVCKLLHSAEFLPVLPGQMRDDALRIYVDEAGHAEMSHALMSSARTATGIEPVPHEPRFLRELARLSGRDPGLDQRLVLLFFVIVSETLITGTLSRLPRDTEVQLAVRQVARDHAADEVRHHAYFRQLFEYLWPRLPGDLRARIGPLLPQIIVAFLAPDDAALTAILASFGDSFDRPERIVAEVVADGATMRRVRQDARQTMRMLGGAGVLRDAATLAAFQQAGLVNQARQVSHS
jgi:P-aminobenzoate N-oxygenase AurF